MTTPTPGEFPLSLLAAIDALLDAQHAATGGGLGSDDTDAARAVLLDEIRRYADEVVDLRSGNDE